MPESKLLPHLMTITTVDGTSISVVALMDTEHARAVESATSGQAASAVHLMEMSGIMARAWLETQIKRGKL